jgi:hypothetical protein
LKSPMHCPSSGSKGPHRLASTARAQRAPGRDVDVVRNELSGIVNESNVCAATAPLMGLAWRE